VQYAKDLQREFGKLQLAIPAFHLCAEKINGPKQGIILLIMLKKSQ
jgi:hypothetical protein